MHFLEHTTVPLEIFVTGDGQQYSSFGHVATYRGAYRLLKFLVYILHFGAEIKKKLNRRAFIP